MGVITRLGKLNGSRARDGVAQRVDYEHFGFILSPTDPLHLFVLIKDVRRVAGLCLFVIMVLGV